MRKFAFRTLAILVAVFVLEIIVLFARNQSQKNSLEKEHISRTRIQKLNHERIKQAMYEEFKQREYLATGSNVYERIYNTRGQTIIELLTHLSQEAFPQQWNTEVKVEEFTRFILLVEIDNHRDEPSALDVSKYIVPILRYGHAYLSSVAVFNKRHKCYLFYDDDTLDELRTQGSIGSNTIQKISSQGHRFTRHNSIRINCKKIENHFFVPVSIYGEYGVTKCSMMVDTGASMTVISLAVARQTGREDLIRMRRETFQTAIGLVTCPLVIRRVAVAGIDKEQEVAVNERDDTNLLGMDFFEDKNYIIDGTNACIYMWSK